MAKSMIDRLLDNIFDAEWTGRHGERLTEWELNLVKLLGRKGKVLRNIYIPKDKDETTEIDVVFISQKGIFVIESKNYSGWIFGDEKSSRWTAMLPNKTKNSFYNPIRQNANHIKWLRKYLYDDIPLFSVIVFSERCELKKVSVENPDIHVIKRDRLYATVRDIWEKAEDILIDEKVNAVYTRLEQLTHIDKAKKQAHVESINKKYTNADKPESAEVCEKPDKVEEPLLCPRCGGQLVLRVAKRGANSGNSFYGCTNYPKCRFVKN